VPAERRRITEKKPKSIEELFDDRISRAIDAKTHQVNETLKEVEKNFRTSIEGHVTYHKLMMETSRQNGDIPGAIRHQVLLETYEGILKNYTLSSRYDNA
jgi:hypothetical protein